MTRRRRGDPNQLILQVAAERRGACTRRQLVAAGVGSTSIARRVKSGFLEEAARGIYVVRTMAEALTPHEVALLAAPKGAISHETAGRMHGFSIPGKALHITVPKGQDNRAPGFKVHETRRWSAVDVVVVRNLRITSPARTLVDLAAGLQHRRLRHLVQEQLLSRRPSAEELAACAAELDHPTLKGARKIRSVLSELLDHEPFPEWELEFRVFAGLAERGIGDVRRQYRPSWYDGIRGIVDGADPASRTIIEADGRRWHATTQAKRDDEQRDRTATMNGWHVVRVGWLDIVERPDTTLDEVASIISFRRAATAA